MNVIVSGKRDYEDKKCSQMHSHRNIFHKLAVCGEILSERNCFLELGTQRA